MTNKKFKYKNKYTSLDINYICKILNKKLYFCRLNNIYDLSHKNYLFKFGKEGVKENLWIESGIRIHTIKENIDITAKRNNFCTILRKHLKNRRIESIEPVGLERVIKINFLDYYLFIELYAKGNIILTTNELNIICCKRDHIYSEEEKTARNENYPIKLAAKFHKDNFDFNLDLINNYVKINENNVKFLKNNVIVSRLAPYLHPNLVNDLLSKYSLNLNDKVDPNNYSKIIELLKYSLELFNSDTNLEGYEIINITKKNVEFSPILLDESLKENKNYEIKIIKDYDSYMEDYFNLNINVKTVDKNEDTENKIWKKFKKIEEDQNKRIENLNNEIDSCFLKGKLIEENIIEIQGIIDIINAMIESGMSSVIKTAIRESQQLGDELALMIDKLDLKNNTVILLLKNSDENIKININLKEKGTLNAKNYYEKRSKLLIKNQKTQDAAKEALKKANSTAVKEIKSFKRQVKKENRKLRWFEKFHWFISSENFLVISAKDALQNEILIKKHMEKDDIVLHAQIQGSPFTLIKYNKDNYKDFDLEENLKPQIPPLTIQEASMSTLCLSKAWKTKLVIPVFWIKSSQVSKTAPTGLYLPTGSFMIYGKKNFINLNRMEMGFGFLFKVSDNKIETYKNERLIKSDIKDLLEENIEEEKIKKDFKKEKNNPNNIWEKEVRNTEYTKIDLMQGKGINKIIKQKENMIKKIEKEKEIEIIKDKNKDKVKISKTKRKKMQKFIDKYGDDKEESEVRNQLYGYKQSHTLKKMTNNFEWNEKNDNESIYEVLGEIKEEKEQTINNESIKDKEESKYKFNNEELKEYKKNKELNLDNDELLEHQMIVDNFKNLTYNPKKDEEILEMLPVCAPFSVLGKYKFKVKLTNGITKRGKALKLIIETFLSMKDITPSEREFMKKIIEVQVIHQVMGDCRVQAAGLLKIKKQQKLKKKNNKKNK